MQVWFRAYNELRKFRAMFMIKKFLLQSMSVTILLIMIATLAYAFLIRDNIFHCSISAIIHQAHHLTMMQHLLILGLLPIYIATIIFGACSLGIYLGSRLKYLFKLRT